MVNYSIDLKFVIFLVYITLSLSEKISSNSKVSHLSVDNGIIKELILNDTTIISFNATISNPLLQGCYIMYPWLNRIDSDKKIKELMKLNENDNFTVPFREGNNYPIHGLYVGTNRSILVHEEDSIVYLADVQNPNFPQLRETFILNDNELIINTMLVNNSPQEKQYFYYGYHPYIGINNKPISSFIMNTNCHKHYIPRNDLIPSLNEKNEYITEIKSLDGLMIGDMFLDDFYECVDGSNYYFEISDIDSGITIRVENGPSLESSDINNIIYKYFHIHTPPSRRSLCIEPLTSPVNAFNVNFPKNVLELNSNEIAASSLKISYNRISNKIKNDL